MSKSASGRSFPHLQRFVFRIAAAVATLAFCAPAGVAAQGSAVGRPEPRIEYAPNESGGKVRITYTSSDSLAIEEIRMHLLENAASIRRGDFRNVRVLRNDLPAAQVLASRPASIRCTFRGTTRGGELVLLSDDDAVVAAIHQLLAAEPPRPTRM